LPSATPALPSTPLLSVAHALLKPCHPSVFPQRASFMLLADRHALILNRLKLQGSLRTIDLAAELAVTEETVRKDLILLAEAGKLLRVHGGARLALPSSEDLPLPERETINRREKVVIAHAAGRLLRARDSLFIDASSTGLIFSQHLPAMPLTVVTNAGQVVNSLGGRSDIQLICTGGSYEPTSRSYVGVHTEEAIRRYHVSWMFLGANGLDTVRGASEINPRQAALKERVLPLADRVCILADHTKLELRSAYYFARIRDIDVLITDAQANNDILQVFRDQGVEVIVAEA
jgi:DeoR/GlpR family transcriptional regulator of sugar metabolism